MFCSLCLAEILALHCLLQKQGLGLLAANREELSSVDPVEPDPGLPWEGILPFKLLNKFVPYGLQFHLCRDCICVEIYYSFCIHFLLCTCHFWISARNPKSIFTLFEFTFKVTCNQTTCSIKEIAKHIIIFYIYSFSFLTKDFIPVLFGHPTAREAIIIMVINLYATLWSNQLGEQIKGAESILKRDKWGKRYALSNFSTTSLYDGWANFAKITKSKIFTSNVSYTFTIPSVPSTPINHACGTTQVIVRPLSLFYLISLVLQPPFQREGLLLFHHSQ